MATLVVIDYENEVRAEEVRLTLPKMQKEYLVDLIDAIIVVRDARGKVKLRQLHNLVLPGDLRRLLGGADRAAVPDPAVRIRFGGRQERSPGPCGMWASTITS